jgi:hypothetical protein
VLQHCLSLSASNAKDAKQGNDLKVMTAVHSLPPSVGM